VSPHKSKFKKGQHHNRPNPWAPTRRRKDVLKLNALRMQLKAGIDALERADFTEIEEADLGDYIENLAIVPVKAAR
jgi:hypothetical protein